jgi:hypothetical protein
VGVAGIVAAMVSLLVFGKVEAVVSTLAGVVIAIANLWSIGYVIRGLLAPVRWRLPFALVASTKMVLLLGGVYLLLWKGWVEPMALCLGLGALPFGLILGFAGMTPAGEES